MRVEHDDFTREFLKDKRAFILSLAKKLQERVEIEPKEYVRLRRYRPSLGLARTQSEIELVKTHINVMSGKHSAFPYQFFASIRPAYLVDEVDLNDIAIRNFTPELIRMQNLVDVIEPLYMFKNKDQAANVIQFLVVLEMLRTEEFFEDPYRGVEER